MLSLISSTARWGREGTIKPSVNLQELRRRIYRKAKAELAGRGGVADSVKVLPAEQAYSALR